MSLGGTDRLWSLVASSVLTKTSHPLLHLRSLFSLCVFLFVVCFCIFSTTWASCSLYHSSALWTVWTPRISTSLSSSIAFILFNNP